MAIKVIEKTERWCCDPRLDLKEYQGDGPKHINFFCKQCGQQWSTKRITDAAGSRDDELIKCGLGI